MLKKFLNKLIGNRESNEVSSVQVLENVSPSPTSTSKIEPPKLDVFEFNVAGVTAKNELNQDIQKLLQKHGKLYAKENGFSLYGGFKNKEIIEDGLEVGEFEDLSFTQHEILFEPEPMNEYDSNDIKVL
ncbi:hypothetical protein [Fictibacillus sp. 26RED30]|uniref:hypothetical protein n=1 Tax=Fictibacillus sp. 26RED30 TaxID=2745877 RepID=UPI0018CD38F1|nr:hypothetical protein [Fictibacillus sp. 26RED30]MBH0162075.1 hypothetical protein [Fictibacillus sp. 26RED30]